jgi:hypothetical protein
MADVVDREVIADRVRDPGATSGLLRATGLAATAAAAVVAGDDVADVVVAGADDLTEDDPIAGQGGAGARGRRRVARRGPARPVGAGDLRVGVEVEEVVVADQRESDRELVLVDLGDTIDQRDLSRRRCRSPSGPSPWPLRRM